MRWSEILQAPDLGRVDASVQVQRPEKISVQVMQSDRRTFLLLEIHPFCSIQALTGLGNTHPQWGEHLPLLSPLTQRLPHL